MVLWAIGATMAASLVVGLLVKWMPCLMEEKALKPATREFFKALKPSKKPRDSQTLTRAEELRATISKGGAAGVQTQRHKRGRHSPGYWDNPKDK